MCFDQGSDIFQKKDFHRVFHQFNVYDILYSMSENLRIEQSGQLSYQVVRSSRKTMAIQIKKDGTIVVRVPNRALPGVVEQFVMDHRRWIEKHYEAVSERLLQKQEFQWEDGAELLLYGEPMKLRITVRPDITRSAASWKDNHLEITVCRQDGQVIEAAVKAWYRVMAKRVISQRTAAYAEIMKVDYNRISIREQSTRWGSCSAKGNLNFNWKLLLMPPRVLDYVVVHELAHRWEMNHSKRFWAVVGQAMPDYIEQRKRLRDYENKIDS